MKNITFYIVLVYVLVFIAASAGAINYGFKFGEHFYTVMGILNLLFGGFGAYKVWRIDNPKTK